MSKDLWFKIQIDDKKIDDLEKKVEKSMEKASSKGFSKGSSKAAGGSGAGGIGRGGLGSSIGGGVFQGMMQSSNVQGAIGAGGKAIGDMVSAARGRGLRVEAEAATLKAAAAGAGAVAGIFSSTAGKLITEGGAAAVDQLYDRSLTTGRGAQQNVEGYLKKLQQQGVSVSDTQAKQYAERAMAFQQKAYEISKQATRAVNAVQGGSGQETMEKVQTMVHNASALNNLNVFSQICGHAWNYLGGVFGIQ